MGYILLKIVAFLIQLIAVVIGLVVAGLFAVYLILLRAAQSGQPVVPDPAGIVPLVIALVIPAPFLFLGGGILGSLILFGFGGLIGAVVDIARSLCGQTIQAYLPDNLPKTLPAPNETEDDLVETRPWVELPAHTFDSETNYLVRPKARSKWNLDK